MSLALVGLGPSPDLTHLSRLAEHELRDASTVLFEGFTAPAGAWMPALQEHIARPIQDTGVLDSAARELLIQRSLREDLVLAVAGHPLFATPHTHLCRCAREAGVAVRVVPGLSIVDVLAAQLGLDVLRTRAVSVEDPRRPTEGEWSRMQGALEQRQVCVVIAVARPGRDQRCCWEALTQRYPGQAQLCSVNSDSASCVLHPKL